MKKLLDLVAAENPKVVEEVVPKLLSLAVVHRVFQNLLAGAHFHPRFGYDSRGRRRSLAHYQERRT